MSAEEFWDLIERAKDASASLTDVPQWLVSNLQTRPVEEIVEFGCQLRLRIAESYDARLWAAASVMMPFCSDDRFSDFQGWLIAQGREIYEAALSDPDSLAKCDSGNGDFGMPILFKFRSAPERAYRAKLGNEIADLPLEPVAFVLQNEGFWDGDRGKFPSIFPMLSAKFG